MDGIKLGASESIIIVDSCAAVTGTPAAAMSIANVSRFSSIADLSKSSVPVEFTIFEVTDVV